jgi:hypothetical protein
VSTAEGSRPREPVKIAALEKIVERDQVWSRMTAKYGVDNSMPPWKTSLDGICDALDHATCSTNIPDFKQRRDEEEALSATVYSRLPYPESQLVSLAHSLVVRGVINETELLQRLTSIRARLEALPA